MVLVKFFNEITGKSGFQENIRQLENEKIVLLKELSEKNNENKVLIEQLNIINLEKELSKKEVLKEKNLVQKLKKELDIVDLYKNSYGEIELNEKKEIIELLDFDVDKSFFDYILPKNENNPFNSEQIKAIRYPMEKNLRIIAGAGSGKTQTICAKAAYLSLMDNTPENKIAMITFTNLASKEMKNRIKEFTNTDNSKMKIGTFHGIFMQLYLELKNEFPYIEKIGINGKDPEIGGKEYKSLLKNLINKYNLKKLDEYSEKDLNDKISYWLNMGFNVSKMTQIIEEHFNSLEESEGNSLSIRFNDMMREFEAIRIEKNIITYDDYLINLLNVLKTDEASKKYIQNRFDYIFIDEFQDTNPLQMAIVNLICPPMTEGVAKLIIVGDDDQSIYFFRGAEPKYIKEFDNIYDTHTVKLMVNYRSIAKIVQAGNRVIQPNSPDRIEKSMLPFHKKDGDCFSIELLDSDSESEWIIRQVERLGLKDKTLDGLDNDALSMAVKTQPNYTSSVVLYRSVSQLKSILYSLEKQNIPFVIESNDDLMGIFNIDSFKFSFFSWRSFIESESILEKINSWNKIIEQLGYSFFINKQIMSKFIKEKDGFIKPELVAEFISRETKNNHKSNSDNILSYLKALIEIKNNLNSKLKKLIDYYILFPSIKRNLTREEQTWIIKEFEDFNNWSEVLGKYEQLKQKKIYMTKQLKNYHEGKLNALYLLTIHRSKGLSFENVFILGVHDQGLPSSKAVMKDDSTINELIEKAEPPTTIEEERRLMYVAITRAKRNLYVTFPSIINDKPCKRSRFLKDLNIPLKKE